MSDFPGFAVTPNSGVIHSNRSFASSAYDITRIATTAGTTSTAWTTANRAIYIPFTVEQVITAYIMGVENGATLNGSLDVGIYDILGTKLVSIGSTTQTGASVLQTFNIADTVLTPGVYFMAMSTNSTTATYIGSSAITTGAEYFRGHGIQEQLSAFALPATATFANPASTTITIPNLAIGFNAVM